MLSHLKLKVFITIAGALLAELCFAQEPDKPRVSHNQAVAYIDSLDHTAYKLIRQDVTKAFIKLSEAEFLAEKIHYEKGLAVTYLHQAGAYNQIGYVKRALELYYRCISLSRRNHDIYTAARAEQSISAIKSKSGDMVEPEKILNRTLNTFIALKKPADIVNVQLHLGLLKANHKQYQAASAFYDKAYAESKKANYKYGEKKVYYNRALLFYDLHKPDSAIFYLHKALRIDTLTKDAYGKALSYIELSKNYLREDQLAQALLYSQKAYQEADTVRAITLQESAVKLQIDASKALGNTWAVIQGQDLLINLNKITLEREKKESVDFIDVLRDQDTKRLKMQSQVVHMQHVANRQTMLIAAVVAILVVLVVVAFGLYYNYKKAKAYNKEVEQKNKQIAHQLSLLDKLNCEAIERTQILESNNQLKNRLLSIISHDLRKPLANTQSLISLFNMKLLSDKEREDLFNHLDQQYAKALNLLDSMLFWIKGQVAGIPAEDTPVNMHDLVSAVMNEQDMSANSKGISISNNISMDTVWLVESEAFKIVFRNLIGNAVKFTPVGGKINIVAHTNDMHTSITVNDTGIGVSSDVLEKINNESYHSSKGTQNEEGSGFGLILIRDLIKKYEGKLQIASTLGQGSAFTITFPASIATLQDVEL